MVTCEICQIDFFPKDPRTNKVCSPTCHGIRLTNLSKEKYFLYPKLCKVCNGVIDYAKRRDVTCSVECRHKFQSENAKLHNRIVWRFCVFCGAKHKNKKYCSHKCCGQARLIEDTVERKEKARLKNLLGVRRYQAKRLNQSPALDEEEKLRMKEIYANCPKGYEVDHKIPISRGGLHHPDNLQYLTITNNRQKSNKIIWTTSTTGSVGNS